MDGPGTKRSRNTAKNFNRLSTAHERYRQTDRQTTDGRLHIANVNVTLKIRDVYLTTANTVAYINNSTLVRNYLPTFASVLV